MHALSDVFLRILEEKMATNGIHWESLKHAGQTVYLWFRAVFIL